MSDSGQRLAVVDAGPLFAALDPDDANHASCRDLLNRSEFRFVIPVLAIGEVLYFIGKFLGPRVEADFLSRLGQWRIESPTADAWRRIGELVDTYRDFPLGGVDASVVALAERLNTDLIATLDPRHFAAIRPRHVAAFRLLPD